MKRKFRILLLVAVALVAFTGSSTACSVCFGDPESPMTKGMAAGILVLLGFIGTVLAGISAFFIYVIRRPEARDLELDEDESSSGSKTESE